MPEMICIKTFANRLEADFAKSTLEANGITTMVSADDAGGMRPDMAFTSGGVRLFVLETNVERALAALEPPASTADE